MLYRLKITRTASFTVQWIFELWLIYFLLFTLFRILVLFVFQPANTSFSSLIPSFLLGFQYDAKWVAIILLPIALFSWYKNFSPFYSKRTKRLWSLYLTIITFFVLLFYGADLGTFSYSHTRINASVLNFSEDFLISLKTLWQTYPIVWIFLGLVIGTALIVKLFRRIHLNVVKRDSPLSKVLSRRWHIVTIIFLTWCLFGIFSFTPVKWSRAFELNDNFKSYLALNPLQNFFATLWFRESSLKKEESKKYFPVIKDFLELNNENDQSQTYSRIEEPRIGSIETKPNVILVVCESFSMYKSSMSGNPLNTTPYFNEMAKEGIFFEKCFSPTFGTARGLFAMITGIPDVDLSKFSTCNPDAADQHTIINDFKDYSKFYFLGGSGNFNNFEGFIKNIQGIKIYQEGSYKSPRKNVWGISDKNLFLEANNVLKTRDKPFFAIIQTADNHRPFEIPEEDRDFEKREIPLPMLKKYGFESLAEFHSFCYTDYCFKKFIEAAKQQPYFKNTIFVFVGDHGVEGNAIEMYPGIWTTARLSDEHIPLLYYAPGLLVPQRRKEIVSQIDVLPTLAGMIHQSYTNATLGRDLLNQKNQFNAAFIIHRDEGNIGVVTDKYYYEKNIIVNSERLVPSAFESPELSAGASDSIKQSLSALTSAIYETSKWMLKHNRKK